MPFKCKAAGDQAMQAGQFVTPTIRLERPLGEGAMGCVWVAEHLTLGTPVAVKLMARDYVQHPELAARFRQEAQAAARLRSPHVTQVLDYGVTPDGEPYIIMELLEGETLGKRLQRLGQLPIEQVVRIVEQTARALSRAHQLGIVHRDIKPDNLFLVDEEEDPFVKVLDFGIAKQMQADAVGMTSPGAVLGTPLYMSPEQLSSPKHIDHRADLWALAVVAYQALTARLPFGGDTLLALVRSISAGNFTMPSALRPELPATIDAWMVRALQCDAAARFESAAQLAQSLQLAAARATIGGPPAAPHIAFADTAPASLPPDKAAPFASPVQPVKPVRNSAPPVSTRAAPPRPSGMEPVLDTEAIRALFSQPSGAGVPSARDVTTDGDEPKIQITDSTWEDAWDSARVMSLSIPGAKPCAIMLDSIGLSLYASFSLGMVLCWELEARRLRWWNRHLARPRCLAKAKGQRFLAVGCQDGSIRLIDAESGQKNRSLRGHMTAVRGVAMSLTGTHLASCSDDKTVRLWNMLTGELLYTAEGHSDRVRSVALSPDGAVLASSGNDSTVRLWDEALRPIRVLRGPVDGVRSVAFSPDGTFLAAGCSDGAIRVWEMGKYEQPAKVLESKTPKRITSVAFGWRRDVLASGSPDGTVRLWNVATGKQICVLPRHRGAVESVAMSLHGRSVVSASEDGTVRVLRFQHGAHEQQ
jgi:eukaryotic-like serine/threonine-protein kinase